MAAKTRSARTHRSRPGRGRLGSGPGQPARCASAAPGPLRRTWSRRRSPPSPTRSAPPDRHSGDQRPARDLRSRRAGAALGRHHQGRRRAPGEPCHPVRGRRPDGETAGSTLRQDLFDLRALARSAGDLLAGRAAAKGLQAQVDISDKLPGLVVGDPVRLRAALENLIDNAVKFTDQGGVALAVAPWRPAKSKVKERPRTRPRPKAGSASPSRCPTAASA